MKSKPTTRVDVNGVKLDVPTYIDSETTQSIAAQVTATIKAIEDSSDRIDTQRFALETCMQLAIDLARERARASTTEDELGLQLASVNSSVETLLKMLQ